MFEKKQFIECKVVKSLKHFVINDLRNNKSCVILLEIKEMPL